MRISYRRVVSVLRGLPVGVGGVCGVGGGGEDGRAKSRRDSSGGCDGKGDVVDEAVVFKELTWQSSLGTKVALEMDASRYRRDLIMHTSIETLLTTNDAIGLYATSIRPQ